MTSQVYYSIDREPNICARLIAQGIRADMGVLENEVEDLLSKVNAHLNRGNYNGATVNFNYVRPGSEKAFEEAVRELSERLADAWERAARGNL